MSARIKTFKQACRANSAKNHRWSYKERFSMGHDAHSMSLIPDTDTLPNKTQGPRVRSIRSNSYDMSAQERIFEDAKYLLETGKVNSVDEAVDRVMEERKQALARKTLNKVVIVSTTISRERK